MVIMFFDNKGIFLKGKEKSTMEDKNFDFAATKDALGQLSADLIEIESALKIKQTALNKEKLALKNELELKEHKIAELTSAAQNALNKIETIGKYIEEAL